jgi:hypothetical protein
VLITAGVLALPPALAAVAESGQWLGLLALAAFFGFWFTFTARQYRLAVVTTPDGRLVVRNMWRTRTFAPPEVEDVRLPAPGLAGLSLAGAVQLLLSDGTALPLEATQAWPGERARHRASGYQQQIRAWAGRPDGQR